MKTIHPTLTNLQTGDTCLNCLRHATVHLNVLSPHQISLCKAEIYIPSHTLFLLL